MPVIKGTTKARIPNVIKLRNGSFNSSLANKLEPRPPQKMPKPPARLNERQRAAWTEIAALLAPLHVVAEVDAAALEILACDWADWLFLREKLREAAAAGDAELTYETDSMARIKPEMQLLEKLEKTIRDALGRFGMTPADRGRVNARGDDAKGKAPEEEF